MMTFATSGPLTPILTKGWSEERPRTLDSYLLRGGHEDLKHANAVEVAEIVNTVKASGLRGHGGAGFLTGPRWSFLSPGDGRAHYLIINVDKFGPGTCKGIPTIMANPRVLIEDVVVTSGAINCHHVFIYLRGETVHVYHRLPNAIRKVKEAGILSGLEIIAHAGVGAHICDEESALLDSLEGRRDHPRIKPPFPAVVGLYARPTIVNNVESIAQAIGIFRSSPEWHSSMGTKKSKGHGIFSLSGHVKNPGQLRAPFGITMRELIDMAGGIRGGHTPKFWTPEDSSAPIFAEAKLDTPLNYESVGVADSMLGIRAPQVFDETVSVVRVAARWAEFYQHESCSKCTPCREDAYWIKQIMYRLEEGQGLPGDVDLLDKTVHNIARRSFCPSEGAAATPITSGTKKFRGGFEAGLNTAACELLPYEASTVYARGGVR